MKCLSRLSHPLCVLAIFAGAAMADSENTGDHHSHIENIGKAGKLSQVTRTINIDMTDSMRFRPAHIKIKQGDTVRFIVKNSGKIKHELIL